MNSLKKFLIFLTIAGLALSCGKSYRGDRMSDEYKTLESNGEIICEAYLFDARVYHDNKYNSFRLQIYYTDTLIGLGGRGYLGKGALKGYISEDSLLVYFPESDEYTREEIVALFNNSICMDSISRFDLKALFKKFPDSVIDAPNLEVEADYEDEDEPSFKIFAESCNWTIDLVYDKQDVGWRISEFYFDDGAGFRLRGRLREFKDDARVDESRFVARIPESAIRIIP